MPAERHSTLPRRLGTFAAWCGAAVAAAGVTTLVGWILDIPALKTVYGPITMKANASIAFLLAGVSLVLAPRRDGGVGAACAIGTSLLGVLTLSQHVFAWDLGIDQILFTEAVGAAATASPNRMGAHASTSFAFAGAALLLVHLGRATRMAQALSFAGAASALGALVGYVYRAEELYGIAAYTGIALHTAVGLLILHVGLLAVRATTGPMALLASDGAAGLLLRRLTPWVAGIPFALGYAVVELREANLVDRGFGTALFALAIVVVLLVIIWHTASIIDVTDRERARAQDAADRANRLKDQFIAILSHELRTPLNVMLGRLRLLESAPDETTRTRAATIVARNGRLLARLVEDLLDLSRASAGQFEISRSPIDVNGLVRTVVDANGAEATDKGVRIQTALAPDAGTLALDAQRMQQVISNLLVNAVKFTPPGGRIDVRTERRDHEVVLEVSDTGIGFDQAFAARLFQPFEQADASSRREHGGLGLGLSIARHLVELHGGTIRAHSPGPGLGAVFSITLPAHQPPEVPAGVPRRARRQDAARPATS